MFFHYFDYYGNPNIHFLPFAACNITAMAIKELEGIGISLTMGKMSLMRAQ